MAGLFRLDGDISPSPANFSAVTGMTENFLTPSDAVDPHRDEFVREPTRIVLVEEQADLMHS